jgi:hypothetical protein
MGNAVSLMRRDYLKLFLKLLASTEPKEQVERVARFDSRAIDENPQRALLAATHKR